MAMSVQVRNSAYLSVLIFFVCVCVCSDLSPSLSEIWVEILGGYVRLHC